MSSYLCWLIFLTYHYVYTISKTYCIILRIILLIILCIILRIILNHILYTNPHIIISCRNFKLESMKSASFWLPSHWLSPNSLVLASSPQVVRYQKLILERLDNEPLLAAFGVDTGFNMQELSRIALLNFGLDYIEKTW